MDLKTFQDGMYRLVFGLIIGFCAVWFTFEWITTAAAVPTATSAPWPQQAAVDFTPLANNAITFIATVLTIAVGILTKFGVSFLASKTKIHDTAFESMMADRVNDILLKAIDYGEAWAKAEVANPNSPIKKVEFNNFIVEQMVKYAMTSMPDLIKFFNLTEERIRAMIMSRLNGYMVAPKADGSTVQLSTGGVMTADTVTP